MHEMALVRNVVEVALKHAEESKAEHVDAVNLSIGYGRDVYDGLFYELFEHLTKGTLAEGAELNVTRVPATSQCSNCGLVYHVDFRNEATWHCRRCGSGNYEPRTGMEFRIDSIEVV